MSCCLLEDAPEIAAFKKGYNVNGDFKMWRGKPSGTIVEGTM
jgi:hypothetical protein